MRTPDDTSPQGPPRGHRHRRRHAARPGGGGVGDGRCDRPVAGDPADGGRRVNPAVDSMRRQVSDLHAELVRYNLVAWTAGNVSGRVPGTDLFVIKPSGVDYDDLKPDAMIV